MAEFFNKVKKGFSKGTSTISVKSSTMMETNKLKSEISALRKEKTEVFTEVGEKFYGMKKESVINLEEIDLRLERAFEIDEAISIKEQAIEDALKKQEELLRALQEDVSSTAVSQVMSCSCGAKLAQDTKFCAKCGKKVEHEEVIIEELQEVVDDEAQVEIVPTTIICECGTEYPLDTSFCAQCGKKLS